jgi:DNA-binding LytR/AlgR family response regulator
MKLKLLAIDDEKDALDVIERLIEDFDIVETFMKIHYMGDDNILDKILSYEPDAILLDIKMPGLSGLEIAKKLKGYLINPFIVFTTAYDQYAIQAIKNSAYDYLLKPIDKNELHEVLLKIASESSQTKIIDSTSPSQKIKINTRSGYIVLRPLDIVFVNADGNYSIIRTLEGKEEISSFNLGKIEKMLPKEFFFRISRSVIINVEYLTRAERSKHRCYLKDPKNEYDFAINTTYLKALEAFLD